MKDALKFAIWGFYFWAAGIGTAIILYQNGVMAVRP